MIRTPLSTVIGGAFWTPGATVIGATVIGGNTPASDQQIQKLFSNGEQGFFYDPNDLSTLYQNAAGTIPVTAVGQPVGLMLDKSGRNNHAYQSTSASRPILQRNATTGAYYLAFDGSDDFLRTNAINFTATNKVSLVAGIRKLSDSTNSVVETGTNYFTPAGGFALLSSHDIDRVVAVGVSGVNTIYMQLQPGYSAPRSLAISLRLDLSAIDRPTQVKFNIDGARKNIANGLAATGTCANAPIFIGRQGGTKQSFNGHIYGLIGIGRLTSDSETKALEEAIAKNVGVTLNV